MFRKPDLHKKLNTALLYANRVCILGATNRIKDVLNTNNFINYLNNRRRTGRFYKNIYYKWTYKDARVNPEHLASLYQHHHKRNQCDPIKDPVFNLSCEQTLLLFDTLVTIEERFGNCQARANLVAKYLWEHPDSRIRKIEVIGIDLFDHAFVVVNRSGFLNNPATWGDAWIIDAWFENGIIIHGSNYAEYLNNTKKFVKEQVDNLKLRKEHDYHYSENWLTDPVKLDLLCAIHPHENRYPTYSTSPFYPIEYYYGINYYSIEISAGGFKDFLKTNKISFFLQNDFKKHKENFQATLTEIKKLELKSS